MYNVYTVYSILITSSLCCGSSSSHLHVHVLAKEEMARRLMGKSEGSTSKIYIYYKHSNLYVSMPCLSLRYAVHVHIYTL